MRRDAWREHPFYENAWGSEDIEWGRWALKAGRKVAYVPEAEVEHSHNYTFRQLFGRRFIEGEADAFIRRGRDGLLEFGGRWIRSTVRDVAEDLREREWRDLAEAPLRRCVYHWAYHRGYRHGERRIREGDCDPSTGQRIVLERQD
jgi:rhamnosyltransferase